MKNEKILKALSGKDVNSIIKDICGKKVSSGTYRDVYEVKGSKRYVIKVERNMSEGQFANVTEWRNYIDNKDWYLLKRYLVPCCAINETGQVLIQRRVSQKGMTLKDMPKKIPNLFTDTKIENWGLIDGEFVCCDYSFLRNVEFKMVKPKWWSLKD